MHIQPGEPEPDLVGYPEEYVILGSDMKESTDVSPTVIILVRMQYSPCLVSLCCNG